MDHRVVMLRDIVTRFVYERRTFGYQMFVLQQVNIWVTRLHFTVLFIKEGSPFCHTHAISRLRNGPLLSPALSESGGRSSKDALQKTRM